jgi:hypothetical protein
MSTNTADQKAHADSKTTTIVINGREFSVAEKEISFEEVISMDYDGSPPTGENWFFSVTYRRGHGDKPQGTLTAGDTVKVKKDMVFDVRSTDKS